MLAVLYSPPRTTSPIDMDRLLECVKNCKDKIDAKEESLRMAGDPYPISQLSISDSPASRPNSTMSTPSPIPIRLTKNEQNELIMLDPHPAFVHRPTPRRVASFAPTNLR